MIGEKLDTVIRELLVEQGKNTEHEYFRYLTLSLSALRNLNLDVSGTPTAVILPVNDNLTVGLPEDYIKYIRIALCDTNGRCHHLAYDDKMCFLRDPDDCGDHVRGNTDSNADSVTIVQGTHTRNGELMGRYFGIGGGGNQNGYYRIDEENGMITLNSTFSGTEIYMEYLADVKSINGEHVVHPYLIEAVKSWIIWKIKEHGRSYGESERERAKQAYFREKRTARSRFKSFTKEEALQTIRKAFKQSPKF